MESSFENGLVINGHLELLDSLNNVWPHYIISKKRSQGICWAVKSKQDSSLIKSVLWEYMGNKRTNPILFDSLIPCINIKQIPNYHWITKHWTCTWNSIFHWISIKWNLLVKIYTQNSKETNELLLKFVNYNHNSKVSTLFR